MTEAENTFARRRTKPITRLGYALLGLIRAAPRSGYALRMVFETTPMSVYSSSPGSIYPALKTLAAAKLVEQRKDERGKQVFALTDKGLQTLRAWLRRPVTSEEVGQQIDLLLLKFAFLQDECNSHLTAAFLETFDAEARAQAEAIQAFLAGEGASAMSLHSRLAVEHGIRSLRTSADWAADAHARLQQNDSGGSK